MMKSLIALLSLFPAVSASAFSGIETRSPGPPSNMVVLNETMSAAVDPATGKAFLTFTDLTVPGDGLRFRFARMYNSQNPYGGPLGRGWTHTYDVRVILNADGTVTVKEGDGRRHVFVPGAKGTFTPPAGVYDVLLQTGDNTFTLTRLDRTVLSFGPVPGNAALVRLLDITDGTSNTQLLSYDINGNLIAFTDVGGATFTLTNDSLGRITSVHDGALNRTVRYSYTDDNLTTYVNAAEMASTYRYSSDGLLLQATDARSNIAVQYTYDAQGRVLQVRRALSCTTTYSYNDADRITTVVDARDGVTRYAYDLLSRLVRIVDALGGVTTYTYDARNNITRVTDPLGRTTTYTYDVQGNRTSVTDPLKNLTSLVYDGAGNLTSLTDPNGRTTNYSYDSHGNLTQVNDAMGGVTRYSYDAHGNRTSFMNANGRTTTYTYSAENRLLAKTDPLKNVEQWTYDAGGRVTNFTHGAGNQKQFVYDDLDHVLNVSYVGESLAPAGPVSYTYDANGNRLRMNDPTGTTAYTYDAHNRVTNITFPGGHTVSYVYDCASNRTSVRYAGGTVNYTYDAKNRMSSVGASGGTTTYSYDAADNLIDVSYPNGATVAYSYDGAGRITQVLNTFAGSSTPTSTPVSSYSYVRDGVGNTLQVTDGGGRVTRLTYDPLDRLTTTTVDSKTTAYTYDAVGNRLTLKAPSMVITYTYDAADRLVLAGGLSFTYDANGNVIGVGTGTRGPSSSYGYDAANRLVTAGGGGIVATAFEYDGDGNRVAQQVGVGTYSYLNDVATGFTTVLHETGPDGQIFYTRGHELVSAEGPGFTYFYQYDAQATVVGLTDASGHLVQRYRYDVWGQRELSAPGPLVGSLNKFGYAGEALDPGTGLYYLRARYYSPPLGRFISIKPLPGLDLVPATSNPFVYARNNPATLTDRTGR
jgi:RHS repeat-associated protein